MKKNDIKVGGLYVARVGANITTVRVDAIREIEGRSSGTSYWAKTTPATTVYDVTNIKTGRKTTFRSAMKFRHVSRQGTISDQQIQNRIAPPTVTPEWQGVAKADPELTKALTSLLGERDDTPETTKEERADLLASELAADRSKRIEETVETMTVGVETNIRYGIDVPVAEPIAIGCRPLTGLAARLATQPKEHPHIIVEARAGTGKTFTIVVGIVNTFRDKIPGLWDRLVATLGFDPQPSPQQQAVWDAMKLSVDARSVQMTAFNKSIVREFETKWGWVIEALRGAGITLQFATNHSMGYAAIRKAFPRRLEVSEYRVTDLIATLLGQDVRELRRKKFEMLKATEKLVSLCKMNLVGGVGLSSESRSEPWDDLLDALASHYDIELNGCRREVFDLVPQVLDACKDPTRDGRIDYDDMIWLPVALDLPVYRNDLLLVDECQDLNRCQQALAKKAGKRLVLVGDPMQAIYGFAGADAESMPRMERELGATKIGCTVLPLTVTRRCGHAIVKEANKIVKDFAAHESNHAGLISEAAYPTIEREGRTIELPWNETYLAQAKPGDFVLCRVNAPLISNCFRFIKRGIKANIQGRDIGAGLVSTIEKLKATSVTDLIAKVSDWLQTELTKEQAKRMPSESRMIAMNDRADCLLAFTEEATSVTGVIDKIKAVFTDDKQGGGIRLSSIHRSKGLESKRVFFLMPKGASCPHPMAKTDWQLQQENNLRYVGITRAIEELIYVY